MDTSVRRYLAEIGRKGGSRKVSKGFSDPKVQAKAQETRRERRMLRESEIAKKSERN